MCAREKDWSFFHTYNPLPLERPSYRSSKNTQTIVRELRRRPRPRARTIKACVQVRAKCVKLPFSHDHDTDGRSRTSSTTSNMHVQLHFLGCNRMFTELSTPDEIRARNVAENAHAQFRACAFVECMCVCVLEASLSDFQWPNGCLKTRSFPRQIAKPLLYRLCWIDWSNFFSFWFRNGKEKWWLGVRVSHDKYDQLKDI